MTNTNEIKEFLEIIKNSSFDSKSRRKTFMDVTRYPHYENVVSNLLAFFFDDSEEHGMGSLWFDSLLSLRKINTSESNITVQREYYTAKGNRIDLLIESDNYVACIENKIYADLSNDLQDYMDTVCNRYAGKGVDIVLFVLSPNLLPKYPLYDCFLNITYAELFNAVKSRMGDYLDKCDNTWLLYMKDFMATIEALCGGSMENTSEFEALFRDYFQEIKKIDSLRSNYIKKMRENAFIVNEALMENKSKIKCSSNMDVVIRTTPYEGKSETRVSIVIDIYPDTDKKRCITVETSRDCWGWHISLMPRTGTTDMLNRLLSIEKFIEQKHPAQEGLDSVSNLFYESHYIIRNIDSQISVEELVSAIILTVNNVISEVEKLEP